ncbi:MAG: hypothetical protein HY054_08580 [Proteobacteria bacterium]|nr:hypothetical protein [Pseudomonadota bacterium]
MVLRTARGLYLLAACVSLALLTLAVVIAFVAQLTTFRFNVDEPVPAVHPPQAEAIAVSDVAARLLPPTSPRFVQDPAIITTTLTKDQPLGYFYADTPNGLAAYPNDFDLIGGPDAASFVLERHSNGHTGLRPTSEFADRINAARTAHSTATTESFTVRVVARDTAGLRSTPTDVIVQIDRSKRGPVLPRRL